MIILNIHVFFIFREFKVFLLLQLPNNTFIRIKLCYDFMKRGYAAQIGKRLKFLSP
jgi:hypothetical protein